MNRIGRSVLWNMAGYVLPGLVAIIAIPRLIQGLGTERFGLLTIAWVVMGYFSFFDLGVGRATTSAVAERMAAGREAELADVATNSLLTNLVIGIVGGLTLQLISPLLVSVLNMSAPLREEARTVFTILAVSVPLIVLTLSLRGILEGLHQFGALNVVKICVSIFNYLAPLVILRWTSSLPVVVAAIFFGRAATLAAHVLLARSALPSRLLGGHVALAHIRPMMGFGGWLTLSGVFMVLTTALDRFVIGARLSTAAVTPYATSYEITTRLYGVSASFMGVMFPVYSGMRAGRNQQEMRSASNLSASLMLLITAAPIIMVIAASDYLLTAWLGEEVGRASTWVTRILLSGALVTIVLQAPATFLQAAGSAKEVAQWQTGLFLLYAPAVWFVAPMGITWVAGVWAFRTAVEAVLLFTAERRFFSTLGLPSEPRSRGNLIGSLAVGAGALILSGAITDPLPRLMSASLFAAATAAAIWLWLIRPELKAGNGMSLAAAGKAGSE